MNLNVVFFGDSICFGQGISIHKGWVPRISQKLEMLGKSKGVDISVFNSSVNGNTTRMAIERMPYDIQSRPMDIILIQFGMNDCNYWRSDNGVARVSPMAFEANLHEIIDRAVVFNIKKIFLNTNHPTTRNDILPPSGITYQQSNSQYSEIIRKVAGKRNEVILVDVEKHILDLVEKGKTKVDEILLPDQLHISINGHDIYFDMVYPMIEREIKKIIG